MNLLKKPQEETAIAANRQAYKQMRDRNVLGNLALTAAALGDGIPKILNTVLKKDVEADLPKEFNTNNHCDFTNPKTKALFKQFFDKSSFCNN